MTKLLTCSPKIPTTKLKKISNISKKSLKEKKLNQMGKDSDKTLRRQTKKAGMKTPRNLLKVLTMKF